MPKDDSYYPDQYYYQNMSENQNATYDPNTGRRLRNPYGRNYNNNTSYPTNQYTGWVKPRPYYHSYPRNIPRTYPYPYYPNYTRYNYRPLPNPYAKRYKKKYRKALKRYYRRGDWWGNWWYNMPWWWW